MKHRPKLVYPVQFVLMVLFYILAVAAGSRCANMWDESLWWFIPWLALTFIGGACLLGAIFSFTLVPTKSEAEA